MAFLVHESQLERHFISDFHFLFELSDWDTVAITLHIMFTYSFIMHLIYLLDLPWMGRQEDPDGTYPNNFCNVSWMVIYDKHSSQFFISLW